MKAVIEPAAFHERFTVCINAEGKPVERTLREMTAAEVLLAMDWQDAEAARLEIEAKAARVIADAWEAGTLDPETPMATLDAAVDALRDVKQAWDKSMRLRSLFRAVISQWPQEMPPGEACRRYWPGGGRAA